MGSRIEDDVVPLANRVIVNDLIKILDTEMKLTNGFFDILLRRLSQYT